MRGASVSYILEALKKSEQERKMVSQSVQSEIENEPVCVGAPVTQPIEAEAKWSLMAVYLALFILLVLILLKLFYPTMSKVDHKFEGSNLQPADMYERKSNNHELKVRVKSISSAEYKNDVKRKSASVRQEKKLIAIEQAPNRLLAAMPALKISSHIYSTQANRRSIVVNGQRMMEGDFVATDMQILEITDQGMVVSAEDWALKISRSRGWGQ